MTSFMNQVVVSVLVAINLFLFTEITWLMYAVFFVVTWLFISINFSVFKNHKFYQKMLIISSFVTITLCIILMIKTGAITENIFDKLSFAIVGLIFIAVILALGVRYLDEEINEENNEKVIPKMIPNGSL